MYTYIYDIHVCTPVPSPPPATTARDVQPTSERCAVSEAVDCEQSCAALNITSAAKYVA